MRMPDLQRFRWLVVMLALAWLPGCAALERHLPAAAQQLTAEEEARVGIAVENRLFQLLGGPRHDKPLAEELAVLLDQASGNSGQLTISVAERGAAELYALPGGRLILTRGLLAEVRDHAALVHLLRHAADLAGSASAGWASRASTKAALEILSQQESVYNPESGSIRLARMFAGQPCEQSCLPDSRSAAESDTQRLPGSISNLQELRPAYALLAEARQSEIAENPSQAITLYLKAATLAPDEAHILGSLGLAYLRAGELQSARLYLQNALRLQPDYYRTRMGLGYLYLQQGQVRKANAELAESVRLLPVTENLFLLAEAREKDGDVEGGMSLYRLIVEQDPRSNLGRTAARRLAAARAGNE